MIILILHGTQCPNLRGGPFRVGCHRRRCRTHGTLCLSHRFTPTSMAPTPRVYVERDVDGLTLFGYAEPEVQQALEGQMEKYEQRAEVEGQSLRG